jgi:large subunit ribosomal protein L28
MARVCDLTGKHVISGNRVSHSNSKSRRKFYPNIQTKRFFDPETKEFITLRVSTSAIRTISKNGIGAVMNKFIKKGHI